MFQNVKVEIEVIAYPEISYGIGVEYTVGSSEFEIFSQEGEPGKKHRIDKARGSYRIDNVSRIKGLRLIKHDENRVNAWVIGDDGSITIWLSLIHI